MQILYADPLSRSRETSEAWTAVGTFLEPGSFRILCREERSDHLLDASGKQKWLDWAAEAAGL